MYLNGNMIVLADSLFNAVMEANLAKAIDIRNRVSISRINGQWKVRIT